MRRVFGRLVLLGAAAGTAYALRGYLRRDHAGPKAGDVQITLDTGATVEPEPAEARKFADIARKVLEIGAF